MAQTRKIFAVGERMKAFTLTILMVMVSMMHGFETPTCSTRRNLLKIVAVVTTTNQHLVPAASAACLYGDLSPDCIGVYKVPMDDSIKSMVGTEEALKKNSPGLRFVPPVEPPASLQKAIDALQAQRKAADDIVQVVSVGRLEEAGIKVLNLIPKVQSAGRVIVDSETRSGGAADLRREQLQSRLDNTMGMFGSVDVLIGQGLRGEMGVSAVAQLTILSELKETIIAFDEFLTAAEVR